MRPSISFSAAVALPFLHGVDGFWRMGCSVVQTGRVDPLVNPGAVAAHAHTIVGGSNIGVNSTYESMVNSACTSCELLGDKSGYWTPLLYYAYGDGSFIEVPHSGSVIYYLARGPNSENIIPFPEGLMMLSGNKALRSFDNETMTWGNETYPGTQVANRVSFVCLTVDGAPTYVNMFNVSTCINGFRAQIAFQSCWNGIDLYKSDNSHVDYLSDIDNGVCSPNYPYQMPTLFFETDYAPEQVPDTTENGFFVFSQGDTTGYGFHGDFINGWNMTLQESAIYGCLNGNPTGVIQECPELEAMDTNGYAFNCPEQPAEIDEAVHGLLDKLPGCITVTNGPESATAADMECNATVTQPHIYTTADTTPRATVMPTPGQMYGLASHQYLGCYNDSAAGTYRALNEVYYTNYTVMTVEFCQSYCMSLGYRLSGVEYSQECHCDSELNPTAQSGSDQCTWNCGGTMTADWDGTQEICGGLGVINIYNNTDPNFNAFGNLDETAGQALPYQPAAPFADNYLGCWSDDGGGRTLAATEIQQNNMTLEICAAYCSVDNGYQYYGTEYQTQCFCGNEIGSSAILLNSTTSPTNDSCNYRCGGSEPEICGGYGVISLYNNTKYIPPAAKPSIGKYVSKGCLTDNTGGRSLDGPSLTNVNMTNEMCVKFCLGNECHYAGVEFASQCYCGNAIVNGGVQETCDLSNLMLCAGDIYEYCGGPNLLNLFYSATL